MGGLGAAELACSVIREDGVLAGYLVYHGPRESIMDFFEALGFQCPERKGIADFLQEVTSRKDQKVRPYCQTCPCMTPSVGLDQCVGHTVLPGHDVHSPFPQESTK